MRIGYGTYGMPGISFEEALPRLADMGYEAVELAVGEKYTTAPEKLNTGDRARLRELCSELELPVPALMMCHSFLADDAAVHAQNLTTLRRVAELSCDLAPVTSGVITFTMGGSSGRWMEERDEIARRLEDYAAAVDGTGCVLAAEPHVGGAIDRPERAVWLVERVASPAVRLNFDISHFDLIGLTIDECVPAMTPHSVHTHVKDGRMVDGKVQFLLPGEGDFDYTAYFHAMQAAGWERPITVEISGMIWSKPDYDPYAAARFSLATLTRARAQAAEEA